VEGGVMHWSIYTFISLGLVVVALFAYRLGKVNARAEIVRDYDEIILRIRQLCQARNYAGLEVFLHDLTEDTPLPPRMVAKNFSRPDKGAAVLNQQQGGDTG
jgi:hypothetical protein